MQKLFPLAILLLAACKANPEPFPLTGTWTDEFGYAHTISEDTWVIDTETYDVVDIVLVGDFLVAENNASNQFNPGKFSRFDWTESGGDYYFCQGAYDADTATQAELTDVADRESISEGCNGFPWTKLQ